MCDLSSNGKKRQALKIDTSNSGELNLKGIYGGLQLESCGDKNCLKSVEYAYSIQNIGKSFLDVISIERTVLKQEVTKGGSQEEEVTSSPIEVINKSVKLEESTIAKETSVIDVCSRSDYKTSVVVKADADGTSCEAVDNYTVTSAEADKYVWIESCGVDVKIYCKDENKNDCSNILPPSFDCNANGCPDNVSFSYIGPLISGHITCTNEFGTILVSKNIIIGDRIELPGRVTENSLSAMTTCQIFSDSSGEKVREFNIDICGGLSLKEVYGGSLRLERCDENRCLMPIKYTYKLENVHANSMKITELLRMRDGRFTEDLLDNDVEAINLAASETAVFTEMEELDVCVEGEIITSVQAMVKAPKSNSCVAEENNVITTTTSRETPVKLLAKPLTTLSNHGEVNKTSSVGSTASQTKSSVTPRETLPIDPVSNKTQSYLRGS